MFIFRFDLVSCSLGTSTSAACLNYNVVIWKSDENGALLRNEINELKA